jgi:hypothetical protein
MDSWSDVTAFLTRRFPAAGDGEALSLTEAGYLFQWRSEAYGMFALGVSPLEEEKILVEFHAVRADLYRQWHVCYSEVVTHFESVVDPLLVEHCLM